METYVARLKSHRDAMVENMRREKEIDEMFDQLLAMAPDKPSFYPDLIIQYANIADGYIKDMNFFVYGGDYSSRSRMNYKQMKLYTMNLKGSSGHISLPTVAKGCNELYDSLIIKDKAGCVRKFNRLQDEYIRMRSKLVNYAQLELQIIELSKLENSVPETPHKGFRDNIFFFNAS